MTKDEAKQVLEALLYAGAGSADRRDEATSIMRREVEPTGCVSNCETCEHHHQSPAHAGHCYMFFEEPQGVCAKWQDGNAKPISDAEIFDTWNRTPLEQRPFSESLILFARALLEKAQNKA